MVPEERAQPPPELVLIVEDHRDTREGYAEYLSFLGFRVAEAKSGMEALAKAFQLRPDLVLMDLALPGLDGWEVTRILKADPRTRSIPVIALSACVFPSDIGRAAEAGCDSFLVKPCFPDAVAGEIRRVLGVSDYELPGNSRTI